MHRIPLFLLLGLAMLTGQGKYPPGTILTIPTGKHINHLYVGDWKAVFAAEDGALVLDLKDDRWLDPITGTEGITQLPILLVWLDESSQDLWMVSPDVVTLYNLNTRWIHRENLPADNDFAGEYSLGVNNESVFVLAGPVWEWNPFAQQDRLGPDEKNSFVAVFSRSSGLRTNYGRGDTLLADVHPIQWLQHFQPDIADQIWGTPLPKGIITTQGTIDFDNRRYADQAYLSCAAADATGRILMGSFGQGVFQIASGSHMALPLNYGPLTPDVMCLESWNEDLWVGGRMGISVFDQYLQPWYIDANEQIVFDFEWVSALEIDSTGAVAATRAGIYRMDAGGQVKGRLANLEELDAQRIYALAEKEGILAIGGDENAWLFGPDKKMRPIFPPREGFTVYDLEWVGGQLWLATRYGLLILDPSRMIITSGVGSDGGWLDLQSQFTLNPVYELENREDHVWATTPDFILRLDRTGAVEKKLTPTVEDFTPRGLLESNGYLWVGTEQGLVAYHLDSGVWEHLDRTDGLVTNFVTDLAETPGYIWLGTNFGLVRLPWDLYDE